MLKQNILVYAAVLTASAHAVGTTNLDTGTLYKGVTHLAQINSSSTSETAACAMEVNEVTANTEFVPTLPDLSYSTDREIPSALKRRLARRYEERGEEVPDYLVTDEEGIDNLELIPALTPETLIADNQMVIDVEKLTIELPTNEFDPASELAEKFLFDTNSDPKLMPTVGPTDLIFGDIPLVEPEAQPEAEPKEDPVTEPEADSTPEATAEPTEKPKAETTAEPEAEATAEPEAEATEEPEAKPERTFPVSRPITEPAAEEEEAAPEPTLSEE